MRRRSITALALAAAAVVVLPLGVTATTAAWNDEEWVHAEGIGTSDMDCGTDEGYTAAATGRFLSGELLTGILPIDLDSIAELAAVELSIDGAGDPAVSPANAIDLGSATPTYTYANPLDISALFGIAGLDLTGLQVGLPVGSAGAVNQYAQVSAYGEAAGASGLVSDSGGVLVSADTPDDQLPEPATISLDELLPTVAGIADVDLEVGAVASSAVLDGCAALRSALWGDGTVTGVTRDYGVASLGLELDSPLVAGLVGTVDSAVATVSATVGTLLGTGGLISGAFQAGVDLAVPGVLQVTAAQGTVEIDGLDLDDAVSALLTTPLSDDVVTIDVASGTVSVDLGALVGTGPTGLNDLPPNTELVVNSEVLNPIVERVGALLDAWTADIVTALTAELRGATLDIDLTTVVRILNSLDVLNVGLTLDASIGDFLDGNVQLTVGAEAAGLVGVLNLALAGLRLPTVTTILNAVLGITTSLTSTVVNLVTTTALGAITTLGSTVAAAVTPVLSALDVLVDALPSVVSVMANVQPDQPGAPPGSSFIDAADRATAQYTVSALRIGLANFLVPTSVIHVRFATSSAGPVSMP